METFTPGQNVLWMHTHPRGYRWVIPVKAVVVRTTRTRVVVQVTKERSGEVVERLVRPESLRAVKEG